MPSDGGASAAAPRDEALTAEEQTRYDRQVRLWGVDAQVRMMKSRVLLVNLHGVGAEVAKNLVLGGVGEVCLCDPAPAAEGDAGSNFLLPRGGGAAPAGGRSRADASVDACRAMNGLVRLSVDARGPAEVGVEGYDVVVATDLPRPDAQALNDRCRTAGVGFVSCNSFGMSSLVFTDFGDEFTAVVDDPSDKGKRRKVTATFRPLRAAWGGAWRGAALHPAFVAAAALWDAGLCASDAAVPGVAGAEALRRLRAAADALCAARGIDRAAALPTEWEERAARHGVGSYAPVCAVAGGVVAQEVLKAVQRNAKPVAGFFVYDGLVESRGFEQVVP